MNQAAKHQSEITLVAKAYREADFGNGQVRRRQQMFGLGHTEIKGEDVATVMMTMGSGMTVVCEMSYASRTERERFPETYVVIEGEKGSLELGPDYRLCLTTEAGSCVKRYPPPPYSWVDPAYELVQASIVPCNADLLAALRGERQAETTGEDNLKTVQLVFSSYESAGSGKVIYLSPEELAAGSESRLRRSLMETRGTT